MTFMKICDVAISYTGHNEQARLLLVCRNERLEKEIKS